MDFPGGSVVKNMPSNAGDGRDTGSIPGSGRSPWRRKWQLTPVFLPVKFHGQRNLVGLGVTGSNISEQLSTHKGKKITRENSKKNKPPPFH